MVGHTMVYGILITDEFGYPDSDYATLIKAIKNTYGYDYPDWIASFPSAESRQLALGFETWVTKTTDFKELDAQWKELMATIPEEFKSLIPHFEQLDPDVEMMSGKY